MRESLGHNGGDDPDSDPNIESAGGYVVFEGATFTAAEFKRLEHVSDTADEFHSSFTKEEVAGLEFIRWLRETGRVGL